MLYDVFISHASEDKPGLVRPLAERLVEQHLSVWYDEFELRLGDSLRRTIDRGLAESRFGIVILSKNFFAKNWPQYELDGLVTRENLEGSKIVLPVWFGIDAREIAGFSPGLAGRYAVSADPGLDGVVDAVMQVIRPRASPLIVARDELISWDRLPPVITDEYWLDVVEASNRVPATGAMVPDESCWSRWSFPLPSLDGTPESRGIRLAWTALQLEWVREADAQGIDLTTEPGRVHDFLAGHPALLEVCCDYPMLAAEYAPQITIIGFGGDLEQIFEDHYQKSLTKPGDRNPGKLCAEEWMLRHPELAGFSDYSVAYHWFSSGMFGPPVRLHHEADYLFWLLSEASAWVPGHIRTALTSGMIGMWNGWMWHEHQSSDELGDRTWQHRGALARAVFEAIETGKKDVAWTQSVATDVLGRAEVAAHCLDLPEVPEELVQNFRDAKVTRRAIRDERMMRSRRKSRQ
jgi:hypothetical protein